MGLVIAVATIASYGTICWIVGLRAAGHGSPLTDAIGVVMFIALVGAAWRRMPDDSPERRRERAKRGYIIGVVTGVQAMLILLTLYVLHLVGRTDLLAPIVAIIVGLHFLTFARFFPAYLYYFTAALLVALGVAGLFFEASNARLLTLSVAAAAILWLTCIAVLIWPESRRRGA